MSGRPFLVVALLLSIVVLPPLARWPLGELPAYAAPAPSVADSAALSNENERKDREERRGREDNQHDNEDDDWTPPPPPVRPPPPPPPPPSQTQACLQSGESLTLTLGDGTVAARVFQGGLSIELSRVDAGSVPAPPGGIVGDLVFRLAAAPCGGSGLEQLPAAINLGVGYRNRVGERVDEGKLTLMLYNGREWTPAPANQPDPANNYVSASVTGLGVYAVVQR